MRKYAPFIVTIFLTMACALSIPSTPTVSPTMSPTLAPTLVEPTSTSLPTSTPLEPTQTQTMPTPTAVATNPPSVSCQLTALVDAPIYQRPSAAADLFGTLTAGESVQPTVKTADGFYGFDPAVAQAGNVGVFRNRWILKTYQVTTQGDCSSLPVVIGPIANLCYAMAMSNTEVYKSSDALSTIVATLNPGDYASVISASQEGAEVDLNVSSIKLDVTGWIKSENIGYNGNCEIGP